MWVRSVRGIPLPGSPAYERNLEEEVEHYSGLLQDSSTRLEPAPPVWNAALDKASARIEERTGADLLAHVIHRLTQQESPRLLSLGCGAAGIETMISRQAPAAEIHCVDVNGTLLRETQERARAEGRRMVFTQADLNVGHLDSGVFDVVFCHASLHHFIALEHVVGEIMRCLGPAGQLIVIDVITRNGYKMFPETRRIARSIFAALPAVYRLNHSAYGARLTDDTLYDPPAAMTGMECHRSEDILPLLRANFTGHAFVPYFSLCRRFFDSMYGPNYDLSRSLDNAIVDWIWELDCHYLDEGILQPETFFGIFGHK